jgi:hypothetical protein
MTQPHGAAVTTGLSADVCIAQHAGIKKSTARPRLGVVCTLAVLLLMLMVGAARAAASPAPNTALYYGAEPPFEELAAFDWVVLEPDHDHDVARAAARMPHTRLLAYLSVGEVLPQAPHYAVMPSAWRIGHNTAWHSEVIDQRSADWPAWFVEHVARPQWQRGYRGFFLDTLDSYQLVATSAAERAAQEAGLVRVIAALRAAFPSAKLIANRGFEIFPQVAEQIDMLAAESLYRRWNPVDARYEDVPPDDREWLLDQFRQVRAVRDLPLLAIDYAPPGERARARELATRIAAHGIQPFVVNASHDQLGLGAIEVLPRRVLMLHDAPMERASDVTYSVIHQYLDMPVTHLGLIPQHLQVDHDELPDYPLAGRIAGIVTHFDSDQARPALAAFLQRAIAEGVRVASLGQPGVGEGAALAATFGLKIAPATARAPVRVIEQHAEVGFELAPLPTVAGFRALAAPAGSQPLLTLRDARGATMDAIAYTPWGGYALWGQALARLPGRPDEVRWVVDPMRFLRQALALVPMPLPDTTTESGRRLLLAHVDGDGFANFSDQPGSPMSSAVLLREIFERYRVPTTMSVIEGETSPDGLYPQHAVELEAIARRIFALPHVEIGSHSYSHPFNWEKAASGASGYMLTLPGYVFDIEREVAGSIRYIEQRLAPPGKKVRLYQWSGNTNPGEAALAAVERAGLASINGGETLITRAQPSITKVAPTGVRKGAYLQVYAPNQNENVYTNHYTGPLYGYERVIETFELTERPRRLKPINLYFHTYAASRRASLEALHKAWRWALAQPVHPIFTSAYVDKVRNFEQVVIARSGDGFLVRGAQALRQLRAPAALGVPQIATSRALAGYTELDGVGERYLHLSTDQAWLRFDREADAAPRLVDANGRIEAFEHSAGQTRLQLAAQVPLQFSLRHDPACIVRAEPPQLTSTGASAGLYHYATDPHGSATITIACP